MTSPQIQKQPLDLQDLIDLAWQYNNGGHHLLAYNVLKAVTPKAVGHDIYAIVEWVIENKRGLIAEALGKHAIALKHNRRAYECRQGLILAFNLVKSLQQCGQNQEACDLASKTLTSNPNMSDDTRSLLFYLRGHANHQLGNFFAAIDDFKKAMPCDGAHGSLMLSYAYTNDFQNALDTAKKISPDFEDYPFALAFAGLSASILGQEDESRAYYQESNKQGKLSNGGAGIGALLGIFGRAVNTSPSPTTFQAGLTLTSFLLDTMKKNNATYVEILRAKAMCHRELGEMDMAEEILTRILPRAFENPTQYFTVFATAARQKFQKGDFGDAIMYESHALEGCRHENLIPPALSYTRTMFKAASEGGYPVLADICKQNEEALQTALDTNAPFPELKELRL